MSDNLISEVPEYSSKSDFSKAELVKKMVEKVCEARSKEMKPGFYNYSMSPNQEIISKIWVDDTRKIYCETVDSLRILLYPEIKRNETVNSAMDTYLESKKALFEKYSVEDGNLKEKVIPSTFTSKNIKNVQVNRTQTRAIENVVEVIGYYTPQINIYWDKRVELADAFFESLNVLIDNLNYFKSGASF